MRPTEYPSELKVGILPTLWRRWGETKRRLLSGVNEEEPSAMMEVTPDEVKLWLLVVIWLLLRRSHYYNCLPFQTRPPLSMKFVEEELRREPGIEILKKKPWMQTLNGNLVKNLPTDEVKWGGKPGDKWEHPSSVGKLMNLNRIMSLVKYLPTQWRETEEENRIRDQLMKNLSTDKGDREENWKIIKCRYCQWKNLPT